MNEGQPSISPAEVRGQAFRSALFGYRKGDVEAFLDELAESYGRVHEEKALLEDRLQALDDVVAEYRKLEQTLQETLIRAEQTSEEAVATARDRATAIVEEAQLEAKRQVDQALQNATRIEHEITRLERRRAAIVAQITAICSGELAMLRNLADASDVQGPNQSDDETRSSAFNVEAHENESGAEGG